MTTINQLEMTKQQQLLTFKLENLNKYVASEREIIHSTHGNFSPHMATPSDTKIFQVAYVIAFYSL